jgi:glutathione S-transferase
MGCQRAGGRAKQLSRKQSALQFRRTNVTQLKLFYAPGACSLAPHIVLEETGAPYEPVRIALAKGEQRTPEYLKINPKGRVPALVEGDWALTENPAILRYLARRFPEMRLWPEDARPEARCAEWLAWIASTIHVAYAHVRRPERYASDPQAIDDVIAKGKETCHDLWGQIDQTTKNSGWGRGRSARLIRWPIPTC